MDPTTETQEATPFREWCGTTHIEPSSVSQGGDVEYVDPSSLMLSGAANMSLVVKNSIDMMAPMVLTGNSKIYVAPSIRFVRNSERATAPTRGTAASAGWDLFAAETVTIIGGEGSVIIPTDIGVRMPHGVYARVAPRSGLAVREHLAIGAGVIDSDYRGSIGVVAQVVKHGHVTLIKKGDRVAQLVFELHLADWVSTEGSGNDRVVGDADRLTATLADLEKDDQLPGHAGWGSTGR